MATDHYTRLGIEKEKFYELNEQEKKELVQKQFKEITGGFFRKLLDIFFPGLAEKRLVQLRSARDILKDDKMREYYNFSLDNGEKPNVDYKSLKNHLNNPDVLNERIGEIKGKLEKIKIGKEGKKET